LGGFSIFPELSNSGSPPAKPGVYLREIISFIEEPDVIRKILVYLDLRDIRNHNPPPKKHTQIPELTYDDAYSQLPFADAWIQ